MLMRKGYIYLRKINLTFLFSVLVFVTKSQVLDWVSLPKEVNDLVNNLTVYNSRLIAAGHFTTAGTAQVNRIASWDGNSWDSLAKGVYGGFNPYVFKTITHNNELIVVGNFDSAGTVASKDIAKWDGTNWTGFGTGSNKGIFSIASFNNEIYVGGTFDSIGGIPANRIAKWNGSTWQSLGAGIKGNNVNDMCVFQNELYVIGVFDTVGNIPCKNIARWNGSNWNNVSVGIDYGSTALLTYKGKLLAGSQGTLISSNFYQNVKQWDGITWSLFSQQQMMPVRAFIKYNNELYCSGGTGVGAVGSSNVMKWDSISLVWTSIGTGVNNYIQGLTVFNNELYCGGYFSKSNGAYHNFIARYGSLVGVSEFKNEESGVVVYPNPANDVLNVVVGENKIEKLELYDVMGRLLLNETEQDTLNISHLPNGTYVVKVYTSTGIETKKVVVSR